MRERERERERESTSTVISISSLLHLLSSLSSTRAPGSLLLWRHLFTSLLFPSLLNAVTVGYLLRPPSKCCSLHTLSHTHTHCGTVTHFVSAVCYSTVTLESKPSSVCSTMQQVTLTCYLLLLLPLSPVLLFSALLYLAIVSFSFACRLLLFLVPSKCENKLSAFGLFAASEKQESKRFLLHASRTIGDICPFRQTHTHKIAQNASCLSHKTQAHTALDQLSCRCQTTAHSMSVSQCQFAVCTMRLPAAAATKEEFSRLTGPMSNISLPLLPIFAISRPSNHLSIVSA